MGLILRAAGTAFIATFSIMELFAFWSTLPTKFSWTEFFHLNSIVPNVTMIAIFGFLLLLGIVSFGGGIWKYVLPFIGLMVIFFELGTQQNFINTVFESLKTYYFGAMTGAVNPNVAYSMIAVGFVLQIAGAIR